MFTTESVTERDSTPETPAHDSDLARYIRPLAQQCLRGGMEHAQKALADQSLSIEDISDVLLVGGTTLTPLVYETVEGVFGKNKVRRQIDAMQAVALGASVLASTLQGIACPDCDETNDEAASQGWCPTILDTNGDGRVGEYVEPNEPIDPTKDKRVAGFAYGVIPNPVDGSIWIARPYPNPVPGQILRLDPETCMAELYEPPFETDAVPPSQWGHGPRGIDVDRNGLIWTALGGSGHLASFDRTRCAVTNGPTATGQHCPEGWTLYATPGPQMKNVTAAGSADFHYYMWVDQFDTLGLGANVPIVNGTTSDSLIALLPDTDEMLTLRVPYPLGFYTRGLDGRIDDPNAGWKGRGVWASNDTIANWHNEGGKGMTSEIVRFQIRPHPLAQ